MYGQKSIHSFYIDDLLKMETEIAAEIGSSIFLGMVSFLASIALVGALKRERANNSSNSETGKTTDNDSNSGTKLYQFMAGIVLVVGLTIVVAILLISSMRPTGPVVLSQVSTPKAINYRPTIGIPAPRTEPTKTLSPSNTPTATPSPTATDTQSPSPTPHSSPSASSTSAPTPRRTPTPPQAAVSSRSGDCDASAYGISLISDARTVSIEVDSVPVKVIEILGRASRSDFTEYLIAWRPIDPLGRGNLPDQWFCQPYPSPQGRDCRPAAGDGNVLQRRKFSDLPQEITRYHLVLRVLGNSNGQYAECIVTLDIRFQ